MPEEHSSLARHGRDRRVQISPRSTPEPPQEPAVPWLFRWPREVGRVFIWPRFPQALRKDKSLCYQKQQDSCRWHPSYPGVSSWAAKPQGLGPRGEPGLGAELAKPRRNLLSMGSASRASSKTVLQGKHLQPSYFHQAERGLLES